MKVELAVTISLGGAAMTSVELAARLPSLGLHIAPALEREVPRMVGHIDIDGDDLHVRLSVAGALATLRAFSIDHPTVAIAVTAGDGGELHLVGGSFGADEDEVAALVASLGGVETWRLLVSYRIDADAHAHILQLVERAIPEGVAPVIDASQDALAIGFHVDGRTDDVADLVAALRGAWLHEGSEVECLIEVEGSRPVLVVAKTWHDWLALERSLRPGGEAVTVAATAAEQPRTTVLVDGVAPADVLGADELTWIDADDQVLCLRGGQLCALTERVEAEDGRRQVRRTATALYYVDGDVRRDIPPPGDGTEQRLHGVGPAGAILSETRGNGDAARTQLVRVADHVSLGPELARLRGLDVTASQVFALAAQAGEVKLIVVELAADWSSATMRPWPSDEEAADVAAISTGRIAVVTERDRRSVLHLIERANLTHSRTLGVPCVAPQIVGHSEDHVWLTGMSPSDAASGRSRAASVPRCDLFRCELRTGRVIVETAELDCTVIDVAVAVGGGRALLVSQRGAYVVSDDYTGIREVVELYGDDEVTGIACGRGPAVFVRGQRGPRLVVGNDRTVVTLASPGHSPLVVRAARMDKRG